MDVTLEGAVQELYRIAVAEGKSTSTRRLSSLARYTAGQLARRGLPGAEWERTVPGIGRDKTWDVAWQHDSKYRLLISLKSILQNISGTVPNRIDDLIGEVANAQLAAPEIVIGYVVVFDVARDTPLQADSGNTWMGLLDERLGRITGRRAPVWSFGMIEGYCLVRVDFRDGPRLLTPESSFRNFLRGLVREVRRRNPGVLLEKGR